MRRLCILAIVIIAANAAMLKADEPDTVQQGSAGESSRRVPPPSVPAPSVPPPSVPAPSVPAVGSDDSAIQNLPPRFRGRAVVLEINARVVEQNQVVVWDESHRKATLPGRPVGIRLVGANLVVVAQFTPYIRHRAQKVLVAQGQIWMEAPNHGIRYQTSMQTIPLEFGEPVYFFPLGPARESDEASIEVMLIMYPYEESEQ